MSLLAIPKSRQVNFFVSTFRLPGSVGDVKMGLAIVWLNWIVGLKFSKNS